MNNLNETIKAATIAIASLIVIGAGMWMLYDLAVKAIIEGQAMLAIIAGLIGAVSTYLFTRDSAQQTSASNERAVMAASTVIPNRYTIDMADRMGKAGPVVKDDF